MCGIHPQSIRLIRKRKTGKYQIQFISLSLASSFKGNVAKHFCGKKKPIWFGWSLFVVSADIFCILLFIKIGSGSSSEFGKCTEK